MSSSDIVMVKVLIAYYSRTGNTAKMAEAVAEGAKLQDIDVEVKSADKVDVNEILMADAIAIGSPTSWAYMSGCVKDMFERILLQARDKISGKPYVSFVSCGALESGKKALESIDYIAGYMKMQKVADGVVSIGAPGDKEAEICRKLGRKLSQAVKW